MSRRKDRLIIPFSGLKEGKHEFDFSIDAKFFEQFEQSLVHEAKIEINIVFNKKRNLLELDVDFSGEIQTTCDRCSDPLEITTEGSEYLIAKFGDEESIDEHILYIEDSAYELDLSDQIYQFVNLSLPAKIEHENEDDCDPTMIEKLREYSGQVAEEDDNKEIDPRWEALNKLKKN